MGRKRRGEPKDLKVTARFNLEEYERLIEEAKRKGQPVSSILRELTVRSIEVIEAKIAKEGVEK